MKDEIKPEDWGWKVVADQYVPVATDLAAAPESMLKLFVVSAKRTQSILVHCKTAPV